MIYPPQEDSLLLAKWVEKLARGKVLDMGTGSGIQAQAAAKSRRVKSVLAVDVDPEVVAHCKVAVSGRKIVCRQSDLFEGVRETFDTIIFNPPYLPQDVPERDIALEGGRQGWETLVHFISQANPHLATDGIMLILFSSLTNKAKVDEALRQHLFDFRQVAQLHIFFEDLFVYKVTKSDLLKRIETSGAAKITYFTRGKRSWIFQGTFRGRPCVVKVRRPDTEARTIAKEGKVLQAVNKLRIGPKLFTAAKDFIVFEYVRGPHLVDALEIATRGQRKKIFRQLFEQAFALDRAGLAKEEMLRPLRNAIVRGGKVVLIDFERTHPVNKPHNVTQLCTFAAQQGLIGLKELRRIAGNYKQNPSQENFKALLQEMDL
jgi:release factor glutamine methyltransferase